jgi:nucleotide sugar dehydrogenase
MNERRLAEGELIRRIDERRVTCAVIGLGYIGMTLADAMLYAGYRVHGFDRSCDTVARAQGRLADLNPSAGAKWSTGSVPARLAEADVVLLAVRALPRNDGALDLEPLESAATALRVHTSTPRLLLVESTVPAGSTRRFAACLGEQPGLFVAHSPERLSVGHDRNDFRRIPHLVGGVDAPAGRVGAHFLRTICEQVVEVSSPEVSELSKLLENAFLTTGIALANEITRIANAAGIDAEEVCAAAATKPFGYCPFFPGPGMGGHCLANDLSILRWSFGRLGLAAPLLDAVADTAARGPSIVLQRIEKILESRGEPLAGLRVLLAGVGFKPATGDTTGTPAREIARLLQDRGADVSYVDSLVSEFVVNGSALRRIEAATLGDHRFGATVVIAGDGAAPLERLTACSEFVLDARGKSLKPRPEGVYTL